MYEKQDSIRKAVIVFVGVILPLIGLFFLLGPFFGLESNNGRLFVLFLTMTIPLFTLWLQQNHESEEDDLQEI